MPPAETGRRRKSGASVVGWILRQVMLASVRVLQAYNSRRYVKHFDLGFGGDNSHRSSYLLGAVANR